MGVSRFTVGSLAVFFEPFLGLCAKGLLPWDKVYGPVLVFGRLWEELGLADQMAELQG